MPAIHRLALERVKPDLKCCSSYFPDDRRLSFHKYNFLCDYFLVFLSKYEAVFRRIGFRRTRVVDTVHNFLKSGEFVTEQLYYIFTNAEAQS